MKNSGGISKVRGDREGMNPGGRVSGYLVYILENICTNSVEPWAPVIFRI
jgi:hypothetical protein